MNYSHVRNLSRQILQNRPSTETVLEWSKANAQFLTAAGGLVGFMMYIHSDIASLKAQVEANAKMLDKTTEANAKLLDTTTEANAKLLDASIKAANEANNKMLDRAFSSFDKTLDSVVDKARLISENEARRIKQEFAVSATDGRYEE